MTSNNSLAVGLCASRHPMPVSGYIFPETVDPMAFDAMEKTASAFVEGMAGKGLVVYVTGLTAATAAVIKVCALRGTSLTLMHYNRDTGEYVPQKIF